MAALEENSITRLASVNAVDVNTTSETLLYTVPVGKYCIVTHIVLHGATVSLTTASVSAGYNASFNDVATNATHTELDATTKYKVVSAKSGATIGIGTEKLFIKPNTAQGAAATVNVEVFGYLF